MNREARAPGTAAGSEPSRDTTAGLGRQTMSCVLRNCSHNLFLLRVKEKRMQYLFSDIQKTGCKPHDFYPNLCFFETTG